MAYQIDEPRFCGSFESKDIEDMFQREINTSELHIDSSKEEILEKFIQNLVDAKLDNKEDFKRHMRSLQSKYKLVPSKPQLFNYYRKLLSSNKISRDKILENFMKKKIARSASGVVVVTIFTSPDIFSCPKNCHYCPDEKDSTGKRTQPRSYLSEEPGCMRATRDKFHPVLQIYDRIRALEVCGHINPFDNEIEKIEIIVSGGTFNFYPKDYTEWFMTSIYYALNTYINWTERRNMLTLEEEQLINETSNLRLIGLTIETRPDYLTPILRMRPSPSYLSPKLFMDGGYSEEINLEEIKMFRRYGITRIQIGIQHTDLEILERVNRECTPEQNMWGIYILKQNGFKVDIHLMLDLPGSTPEKDLLMMEEVLINPMYQADQWKIYPTAVVNHTKIKEWYLSGIWKPYAELEDGRLLKDIIKKILVKVHPWIRINRVIRDIPSTIILGGNKDTSMRDKLDIEMEKEGLFCHDIRNREIKEKIFNPSDIKLKIRKYKASFGMEYFISYESFDELTLYGFIRLRHNFNNLGVINELHNMALIRELHVYGIHTGVTQKNENGTQHQGLGKKLLKIAERISYDHGFKKIAIISGVGVRQYYRKLGYLLENTYMTKNLKWQEFEFDNIILGIIMILMILYIICLLIWFF